jgi:hypothetical protein
MHQGIYICNIAAALLQVTQEVLIPPVPYLNVDTSLCPRFQSCIVGISYVVVCGLFLQDATEHLNQKLLIGK